MSRLLAPYDWHPVNEYLPQPGEIVVMRELYGWAEYREDKWIAVDECGNRRPLLWQPTHWRRQYIPADPEETN